MEIFVEEIGTTPNSTASQMFVNGKPFCFVLEDGFREVKVKGITRIPAGRYKIVGRKREKFYEKYKRDFGHEFSIEIENVPDFSDVLIHIGNTIEDTRGCLLVNRLIGFISTTGGAQTYCGVDSTSVYKVLYTLVESAFEAGQEVWLEISRRPVVDEGFAG